VRQDLGDSAELPRIHPPTFLHPDWKSDSAQNKRARTDRLSRHPGHHRAGHRSSAAGHFGRKVRRSVRANRGDIDPRILPAQRTREHHRILMLEVIGEIVQPGYPVALLAERDAFPRDCRQFSISMSGAREIAIPIGSHRCTWTGSDALSAGSFIVSGIGTCGQQKRQEHKQPKACISNSNHPLPPMCKMRFHADEVCIIKGSSACL
jgi:hypothetical protein